MIKNLEKKIINDTLIIYLGFGTAPIPQENREVIVNKFGQETMAYLELMLNDFDSIEPDWNVNDIHKSGEIAVAELSKKYPFLSPQAKNALIWAFTYWWK